MFMSFGVRAHDFGRGKSEELASLIAKVGATHIQLAPMKALEGFDPTYRNSEQVHLSEHIAFKIRETFESRGIRISILGCYFNMAHPDLPIRQQGIRLFQDYLKIAKHFGTSRVGTETGSIRADYGPDPANRSEEAFKVFLSTVSQLVSVAQTTDSTVCIEAVAHHIIYDARRMDRVLKSIGSPHLAVVFDPVNLITSENANCQERIFEECFSLWGDRIQVVHLKDFVLDGNHVRVVPPGKGNLDFALIGKYLGQLASPVDIIIENCKPDLILTAVLYLQSMGLLR